MSEKRRDARRIKKIILIVFVLAIASEVAAAAEYSQPAALDVFTRDMDLDDDGVWNVDDNCPLVYNPVQDMDGDGIGEACNNGYDVDLDGIFDSVETELINTFAPIVYLHSEDAFKPAGVDWLFETANTATLMGEWAGPGGTPLWLFQPIGDGINLLGVEYNGLSSGPAPVANNYAFKIDMFNIEDGSGVKYGNLPSAPFYASVGRGLYSYQLSISYWFFYPWNDCGFDWVGVEYCSWTHEGDWEHIVVWVHDYTPVTGYTPEYVDYYFHDSYDRISWNNIGSLENRPIVFSALQTHASYASPGYHAQCLEWAIPDVWCLWGRSDYTDWGVLWDPLASGGAGVLNVGQRQLKYSYDTSLITAVFDPRMGVPMPGMEWILYEGRWGRDGEDPNGVKSPRFEWYEGQGQGDYGMPPALWKVPDQQAQAGTPNYFDLGFIFDIDSDNNSQTLTARVDWGDGIIDQLSGGVHEGDLQANHTYSAPGEYYVEVRVFNFRNHYAGNVFKVTVTGAPPTDIALYPDWLHGNMPVGTLIGNFSATDPTPPAAPFVYELVPGEGADDNASFTISGDQLLSAAVFDYNIRNTYSIRVRATDFGGMYREEAFTINVTANITARIYIPIVQAFRP